MQPPLPLDRIVAINKELGQLSPIMDAFVAVSKLEEVREPRPLPHIWRSCVPTTRERFAGDGHASRSCVVGWRRRGDARYGRRGECACLASSCQMSSI